MMEIITITQIILIYIWVTVMCVKSQGFDESISDSDNKLPHFFCSYIEHQQAASRDHCSCYSHISCNPSSNEVSLTCEQGYKLTGDSNITTDGRTLADLITDIPKCEEDLSMVNHCPDNPNDSKFCSILTTVGEWGIPIPKVSTSVQDNKWYVDFKDSRSNTGTNIGLPSLDSYNGTFCLSIKYSLVGPDILGAIMFFSYGFADIEGEKDLQISSDPVSIMWELEKEAEVWLLGVGRGWDNVPAGLEDWTFILHTFDIVESSCPL